MGDIQIHVNFPLDDEGMFGRECLECKQYFKVTPGTGVESSICHCPYCSYEGGHETFWTEDQIQYGKSIAMQQALSKIVNPMFKKLNDSFKKLERSTRNSLIKIKVTTQNPGFTFPIEYYSEKELETKVTCDGCGLIFAIFGVFSKCPGCNKTNAFLIYDKSLELIRRTLDIFSKPEIPDEIKASSLSSIITLAISSFDGLGKELREVYQNRFPQKPKNLFQNILLLDESMSNLISSRHSNFDDLFEWFQVRHIIEHNMGVVDNDFVAKIPEHQDKIGRKFSFSAEDLYKFLDLMDELGQILRLELEA
jgi:hypothetical protein